MIFRTYKCYKLEHPEFCITCDPNIIPDIDADWILNFLEDEVKKGGKFTTNETIQSLFALVVYGLWAMPTLQFPHSLKPNLQICLEQIFQ